MKTQTVCIFLLLTAFLSGFSLTAQVATPRTVMNNNDDGSGSLRQTIADANDGDRIVFDDGITTITLQSELDITDKILTIDGGGKVTLLVASTGYRHIYAATSDPSFSDNLFTLENMTVTGLGGSTNVSGGISCNTIMTINNCVINNCHNTDFGGGVFTNRTVNLTNCTVTGNSSDDYGGGIYTGGSANLTNCTVSGNSSQTLGGGILTSNIATLTNCTVSGNSAKGAGGGLYNDYPYTAATLTNCTVSGNSSTNNNGGGIYTVIPPTLQGTIIAGNYTAGAENEISINGAAASNGDGTLQNGNMSSVLTDASAYYIVGMPSGDLSRLLQTVTGSSPLAPLLTDNGGPMQTILPAVHNSYSPGSGAMLNAIPINTTTQAWLPATDQRGITRPATGSCTVGAVEVNGSLPDGSLMVTNANSSGVGSLSKAVAYFNSTTVSGATLPNAVITFDPAFFNTARTITLTQQLNITGPVTITGPGVDLLTIYTATTGYRHFYATSYDPNFNDVLFTLENMTVSGLGGSTDVSGGVSCDGLVTINNCVINNCHNTSYGGGVFTRSTATLTNCTVTGNSSDDYGGGIYTGGSANLTNCTVSGNSSQTLGGGILTSNIATLTNCTVSGNSAKGAGGGLYNDYPYTAATLTNCTVSGNSSTNNNGGGIYTVIPPTLLGTIITGNYTAGAENEISINGAAASNGDGTLQSGDMSSVLTDASAYYIVGIPTGGDLSDLLQTVSGSSPLAPLLADNGGGMPTILPNFSNASNPALNAVPADRYAATSWNTPTDQIGIVRPTTGNGTVGAVEAIAIASAAVTVTVPATGDTPDVTVTIGTGSNFTATASWSPADNPFLGNTAYTAQVILTAAGNYGFAGLTTATATINGQPATVTYNSDGTVTLSYQFPATAAITSPTNPDTDNQEGASTIGLTAAGGTYSNNSIVLTATVSIVRAGVTPAPTGVITFMAGATTLGVKTLNSYGTATYTLPAPIAPGSYTYTAYYSGDSYYTEAVSDPCTVEVEPFLSVTPATLHFDAPGGTQPVVIECTDVWSLSCDAQWLTASVSESQSTGTHIVMNVTATANLVATPRTALITVSLPGLMAKTVDVTQEPAANSPTGITAAGAPSITVYSQGGNAMVKSDAPIRSVAVYDIAGKMLKQVKGGNTFIVISGLPKQQVLIVRVTGDGGRAMSYKLRIENYKRY